MQKRFVFYTAMGDLLECGGGGGFGEGGEKLRKKRERFRKALTKKRRGSVSLFGKKRDGTEADVSEVFWGKRGMERRKLLLARQVRKLGGGNPQKNKGGKDGKGAGKTLKSARRGIIENQTMRSKSPYRHKKG